MGKRRGKVERNIPDPLGVTTDSVIPENIGIGNELNRILQNALSSTFTQGELAQLSHSAFDNTAAVINARSEETITFAYPIGYRPSKEPMVGSFTYKKEHLIERYAYLAHTQIPMNGIYQLAMTLEGMFSDLIRQIILRYPAKLGSRRQISIKNVLDARSLEELHLIATDSLLNELSYKSPRDFAGEAEGILSVNLLECPAYHIYIEMKATRDVLIHNKGIANKTYVTKSGSHARTEAGIAVPIGQVYFLEVYEACLQLIEWLESKIHENWHSSEYETRQTAKADDADVSPS